MVAALTRAPGPGNVRQLRNVVRQLLTTHLDAAVVEHRGELERLLGAPPQVAPPTARRDPSTTEPDALRAALRDARYEVKATARALGISRTTVVGSGVPSRCAASQLTARPTVVTTQGGARVPTGAGQHPVQHGAQQVHVGRAPEPSTLAQHLGRHVAGRAQRRAAVLDAVDARRQAARQAPVDHVHLAVGAHQDVLGLQIQVHHAAVVREVHGTTNLQDGRRRAAGRARVSARLSGTRPRGRRRRARRAAGRRCRR